MSLTLTTESAKDFSDARRQAEFESWLNFFTGRPNDLLSFEEVRQNLKLQDSAYKGLKEIELDKIVGSTGRYRDFTRSFLPKTDQTQDRWRRVDAIAQDMGFPPIEVYKVGDVYFVRDGNHRVSVARKNKAKTIEAYVIEYKTNITINKDDALADIQDKMDKFLLETQQQLFFERTNLNKIRPDQNVVFTEPGRYRLVRTHINFHKYLKETELGHEISYEEAVASWYDNVYLPIVESIRVSKILDDFPGRTEADLYAWLLLHRAEFEQEVKALGYVPTEDLIETLKRERATNPFARFMGLFRSGLDTHTLSLKVERAKFLKATNLDEIRPKHNVKFTESGCYELAEEHINVHKYLKETELGHPISYEEAVAGWFDNVYAPVVNLIREHHLNQQFTKNTEADLYLWLVSRRAELEEEKDALGKIPDEKIIADLAEQIPSGPLAGLIQYFREDPLNLQGIVEQHQQENGETEQEGSA